MAATHAAAIEPLVTHTLALDDVSEAFAIAADKTTRAVKVQIQPSNILE